MKPVIHTEQQQHLITCLLSYSWCFFSPIKVPNWNTCDPVQFGLQIIVNEYTYICVHMHIHIYVHTISGGGGGGLVSKSCPILATLWTVACQAPLSMGFSRQEYWSGLPFPSPGDLPNPGIEPGFPALQADSLPTELWAKPYDLCMCVCIYESRPLCISV